MHDLLHWVHIQVNFICMPFGLETLCFIPTALRKDSAKIISQLKVPDPISHLFLKMMRHHPSRNLGFKFQINQINRLDTRRYYKYFAIAYRCTHPTMQA